VDPSPPTKSDSATKTEWADVVGIAAAATAILSTIGGLAVTGALQRMQRDHGLYLVSSLSLAIGGATLWIAFAILKPMLGGKGHWTEAELAGHLFATAFFVIGIIVGILGMVQTQADQPRPMVSATLDPSTLALDVTASVHNLGINHKLVTVIVGLNDKPNGGYTKTNRYLAISGPDQDGNVTQHVVYTLPKGVFSRVGITASTGGDTCDLATRIRHLIDKPEQSGCAVIILP
jgi:hypothetical protein